VSGRLKQIALREWQGALQYWVLGWLLASLICSVIRPFGTVQFSTVQSVGYWLLINGIAVLVIFGVLQVFKTMLSEKFALVAILGSIVFTLLFTPILIVVNDHLFDLILPFSFFITNFFISLLVFCIVRTAMAWRSPSEQTVSGLSAKFENRLTKYQTAQLWAISAQDHYLHVQTDQGSELILMRFSDALAELDGRDGVQIHRSHWVARGGVAKNNSTSVTLHNAVEFPISRSNSARTKAFFAKRLSQGH